MRGTCILLSGQRTSRDYGATDEIKAVINTVPRRPKRRLSGSVSQPVMCGKCRLSQRSHSNTTDDLHPRIAQQSYRIRISAAQVMVRIIQTYGAEATIPSSHWSLLAFTGSGSLMLIPNCWGQNRFAPLITAIQ
jgi:hypothetical protein